MDTAIVLPAASAPSALYKTPAKGVHDTLFNRWKTYLQIAISRRIPSRRHPNASILYLSATRLVKYGRTVHMSEAAALLFLAASASKIPVPKLHYAFRDDKSGVTYIVMERMDGQSLSDAWSESFAQDNEEVFKQLRCIFDALRALKKPAGKSLPDGAVCAADGGRLHDYRIWNAHGLKGMGPFSDEAEFNLFLRNGVSNTDHFTDPETKAEIQRLIEMHREREERKLDTVFTHGDLSPSNVLVKGGKVVAVVDWEMSGWYPRYWEYTTAINANYIKGWTESIGRFLDEWPEEKKMDDLWRKYYCD